MTTCSMRQAGTQHPASATSMKVSMLFEGQGFQIWLFHSVSTCTLHL